MQFPIARLASLDIGLASLLYLLLERIQYMNSITSTDNIENPERAAAILDPNLPNATAYTGERLAVQWVLTKLQQLEFVTDVDSC